MIGIMKTALFPATIGALEAGGRIEASSIVLANGSLLDSGISHSRRGAASCLSRPPSPSTPASKHQSLFLPRTNHEPTRPTRQEDDLGKARSRSFTWEMYRGFSLLLGNVSRFQFAVDMTMTSSVPLCLCLSPLRCAAQRGWRVLSAWGQAWRTCRESWRFPTSPRITRSFVALSTTAVSSRREGWCTFRSVFVARLGRMPFGWESDRCLVFGGQTAGGQTAQIFSYVQQQQGVTLSR